MTATYRVKEAAFPPEANGLLRMHFGLDEPQYFAPACPACGSRRTQRLAQGYPIRMCVPCGRSSLYGALVPEKGE